MHTNEPEPTPVTRTEVLIWDERETWCKIAEWPGWGWKEYLFARMINDTAFRPTVMPFLLDQGWSVVSCSVVPHGFLWLKQARVWTLTRPVTWLRYGTEESHRMGERTPPTMFTAEYYAKFPDYGWPD
jgi:hypothetical protein